MTASTQPGEAIPFEQARGIVEEHAASVKASGEERVPLLESPGRVLAEDVEADRDFPPFARSLRDGFAVRAEDVASVPAKLSVIGEIRAGESRDIKVTPGTAVEIMTGAAVPAGADAVVMVEYTDRQGDGVTVRRGVRSGENIVPKGAEARTGDVLLARGYRMNHAGVAVAAAVGGRTLSVYRRPKVAILVTGDELVGLDQKPGERQIRNSNAYSLAAQVRAAGGEPLLLPVAPDEPVRMRELMRQGLEADLLLTSGGVSMGKYDLVENVLGEFEAQFFFTGVLIQPGKPTVFGRARGKYFFGLPGNPVSTMVTFELFARPMVNALGGAGVDPLLFMKAQLRADIQVKPGLTRFLPAALTGEYHSARVELVPWKGSGDVAAAARSNCYIVVPRNKEHIFADEMVDVMM